MYGAGHLLRQMDTDRNGTVSKEEYGHFMVRAGWTGPPFERLDTNRNGKLERNELRPLIGGKWARAKH
jgi:Ca2+-binding EF-hand superfamily protein